jgi:vacuolar-type H+-ATPase subunit H
MARQRDQERSDPVVVAIERVLEVERDGALKLQSSQEEARNLLAEARAEAATIAKRADGRISKLHANYLQKVQRDIERLQQSNRLSGERADGAYDRARLVRAVRLVAIKLTGGP